MKPALLIIDVQKQFFNINQTCAESLKSAIEYINATITLFRKKNHPIFIIQHRNDDEDLVPGKPGFDLPETLNVEPQDTRITKTHGNSFANTGLTEKIRQLGIDTVFLTGFCAEYCVLSTYRGAEDLDITPIIVKGSLASPNAEHIRFVEEVSETISFGALKALL